MVVTASLGRHMQGRHHRDGLARPPAAEGQGQHGSGDPATSTVRIASPFVPSQGFEPAAPGAYQNQYCPRDTLPSTSRTS